MDLVRRIALPNSFIIGVVIPIPDKFRCIKLLFILMNLTILRMLCIELFICSYSTMALAACVLAFFYLRLSFSLMAWFLIFSAGVDSAKISCIESCKLLYDMLRSCRERFSTITSISSYIWWHRKPFQLMSKSWRCLDDLINEHSSFVLD